MDEPSSSSSSSSSSILLLSRSPAIDRHNPIITDSRRSIPPTNNHTPRVPTKSHHKINNTYISNNDDQKITQARKNSTDKNAKNTKNSCTKPTGDFFSPPGSTRYLLSDKALFDSLSGFDPTRNMFPDQKSKSVVVLKANGSGDVSKSPSHADGFRNQVVVLRVSLHCRGCEKKMRKHISKMEGVTSFNIDFPAKKVTVTGNITPLEVLSTISKVKNAQIWSPNLPSSTQSALGLMSSNSEIKNEYKGHAGA